MSHELRTPLARIRVALDIAAEGDVSAARQCLEEIGQDWGDLDKLVEGVLTVARLDLARDPAVSALTVGREQFDAKKIIERAIANFRALHAQHQLEVLTDCDLTVVGDSDLLRRVLDNLLNNAAKYSDPGMPIELVARGSAEGLAVSVSDHGIGIDAHDIPRLFEPFFRSDRSRARKTGGVGLNLTLAKRIVAAHGGHIEVKSELGRSTTVRFTVPLVHTA